MRWRRLWNSSSHCISLRNSSASLRSVESKRAGQEMAGDEEEELSASKRIRSLGSEAVSLGEEFTKEIYSSKVSKTRLGSYWTVFCCSQEVGG